MVPLYVVQRKSDGYFWSGGNRWAFGMIGALWFESETAANLRALRELPDRTDAWEVIPMERRR